MASWSTWSEAEKVAAMSPDAARRALAELPAELARQAELAAATIRRRAVHAAIPPKCTRLMRTR